MPSWSKVNLPPLVYYRDFVEELMSVSDPMTTYIVYKETRCARFVLTHELIL